jgi:hypothetical protein
MEKPKERRLSKIRRTKAKEIRGLAAAILITIGAKIIPITKVPPNIINFRNKVVER